MIGLCFGLIGTVLTFFGMECTHIGGGDRRSNDQLLITAAALHLVGCEYELFAFFFFTFPVLLILFCLFYFSHESSVLPHAGGSDVAAFCLYINRVLEVFLHSEADPSKLR